MHNYATDAARRRPTFRGGFSDLTEDEIDVVPDWIAKVNMGFSLAALALLVTAIVIWV